MDLDNHDKKTEFKSILDRVIECDAFPYYNDNPEYYKAYIKGFHTFHVKGCDAVLGYMPNEIAQRFSLSLLSLSVHDVWEINSDARTVTLVTKVDARPEDRTAIVAATLTEMRQAKTFEVLDGWRNELYPVYGSNGELLVEIERSACPLFGVVSYGIHMTAYVESKEEGLKIWVPKRSPTKQTFPGMFDNTVGGGMTTGELPFQCAIREAMEEASFKEDFLRKRLRPVGCLSYNYMREKKAGGETGLSQPEIENIFDLKLDEFDEETKPKTNDGEAQDFRLLTVGEVLDALKKGEFKANCGMSSLTSSSGMGF